jgi:MFS family permease
MLAPKVSLPSDLGTRVDTDGMTVALGGWIVTFMLRVRNASAYASGISATGFWAGMTVGRALLGFITERYGERLCVTIYLALAIGLELVFWLVPKFVSQEILPVAIRILTNIHRWSLPLPWHCLGSSLVRSSLAASLCVRSSCLVTCMSAL